MAQSYQTVDLIIHKYADAYFKAAANYNLLAHPEGKTKSEKKENAANLAKEDLKSLAKEMVSYWERLSPDEREDSVGNYINSTIRDLSFVTDYLYEFREFSSYWMNGNQLTKAVSAEAGRIKDLKIDEIVELSAEQSRMNDAIRNYLEAAKDKTKELIGPLYEFDVNKAIDKIRDMPIEEIERYTVRLKGGNHIVDTIMQSKLRVNEEEPLKYTQILSRNYDGEVPRKR